MEYITFVYALVLSLAQTFLGFGAAKLLARKLDASIQQTVSGEVRLLPVYWIFGLLLHLSLILLLKILRLDWMLATAVPFLLLIALRRYLLTSLELFNAALPRLFNPAFLIWFALQVLIASSLFTMHDGIGTPWMNNYGDLTFHLGMITNFAASGNFPADYHVYAGEQLSYPFFVNLWAAALWFPFESFGALKVVFLFQWLALWSTVYALLVKRGAVYLPWLLFFGGGSYYAILKHPEPFSWQLISEGYPWTTWLSTIWVTQRSAMLGLAAAVAAASLALKVFILKGNSRWAMAMAGLLLAMMPLAHTHYFLFTALFLGLYLLVLSIFKPRVERFSLRGLVEDIRASGLLTLVIFSLPAVVFFPLLLSKSGMAELILGWTVPAKPPGIDSLVASAMMWVKNAPQWLVAAVVFAYLSRKFLAFYVLLFLFLLANLIQLASWEWDQLKVFLVIFTMMLVVWRRYLETASQRLAEKIGVYALALLLCGPGIYEAFRIVKTWPGVYNYQPNYQVYHPDKLELAELIYEHVPADAVIASPSDHNSAATLSGRNLFFGYPGTLASHNIPYQTREAMQKNLSNMRRCEALLKSAAQSCPGYLIWDAAAPSYWGVEAPGEGFTKIATTKDGRQRIYKRVPKL